MSIIDRLFAGNVIKDFGTLDEKSIGLGKVRHSALLIEKHGQLLFAIKLSMWGLFGASVSYQTFTLKAATRIRDYINESEQIARNLPPLAFDFKKVAIRNMLIIWIIASAINLFTSDESFVFLVTLFASVIQANQFLEYRSHPDIDSRAKVLLFLLLLFSFAVGVVRFLWLSFGN